MIKLLSTAAFVSVLALAMPACAKTTHFYIDDSKSNKAVTDKAFAKILARKAAKTVMAQKLGDHISIRTFGDINETNPLRYDAQLTRRSNPPATVGRNVARLIMKPATSTKARQQKTEIVAMLQWNRFNCAAGDHVIVLTDAIETGAVRSPSALLNGKASLPMPKAGSMRGCSVSFWGIGRVSSGNITSAQVNNLTKAWARYFRIAGAKFYPVPNP